MCREFRNVFMKNVIINSFNFFSENAILIKDLFPIQANDIEVIFSPFFKDDIQFFYQAFRLFSIIDFDNSL